MLNDEVSRKYIQSLKRYVSSFMVVNTTDLLAGVKALDIFANEIPARRCFAAYGIAVGLSLCYINCIFVF